jgi:hypothetical protein
MPTAARKARWTPDVVRERIRTGMLLNRLQNHVLGRLEMSKTQIQAAAILLRKTLPDMVATVSEGRPLDRMNDEQLIAAVNSIRGYLATEESRERVDPPSERTPLN